MLWDRCLISGHDAGTCCKRVVGHAYVSSHLGKKFEYLYFLLQKNMVSLQLGNSSRSVDRIAIMQTHGDTEGFQ
jgi:hypothetical protein